MAAGSIPVDLFHRRVLVVLGAATMNIISKTLELLRLAFEVRCPACLLLGLVFISEQCRMRAHGGGVTSKCFILGVRVMPEVMADGGGFWRLRNGRRLVWTDGGCCGEFSELEAVLWAAHSGELEWGRGWPWTRLMYDLLLDGGRDACWVQCGVRICVHGRRGNISWPCLITRGSALLVAAGGLCHLVGRRHTVRTFARICRDKGHWLTVIKYGNVRIDPIWGQCRLCGPARSPCVCKIWLVAQVWKVGVVVMHRAPTRGVATPEPASLRVVRA